MHDNLTINALVYEIKATIYGVINFVAKRSIFSFEEWDSLLLETFEKYFWIEEELKPTDSPLIHRRGIYKDCLGATHQYTDFQLRPNQCVAMVVVC